MPELKILSNHIFVKTKANALTSEKFSEFIRAKDIKEFYITGADATGCVKSTCFNMTKAECTVHVIAANMPTATAQSLVPLLQPILPRCDSCQLPKPSRIIALTGESRNLGDLRNLIICADQ